MSIELTYRQYLSGDEEGIIDVLLKAFPVWRNLKYPFDYWKWKYIDAPFGATTVVALHEKKVVCVGHTIYLNLKLGYSIVLLGFGADAATLYEYRGMGAYKNSQNLLDKLTGEIEKFHLFLSDVPTVINDSVIRGRIDFSHQLFYMIKIKDVDLHLKAKPVKNPSLMKYGYFLKKTLNRVTSLFIPNFKNKSPFVIEEIKNFDDRINYFWLKAKEGYTYITEKNRKYLNWRYCDPRAGEFIVLQAISSEMVLGYIVIEVRKNDDYAEGYIVDLLTLPDRIDVADNLFTEGERILDKLGVNTIYYMIVEGHPYQKISLKHGLIRYKPVQYLKINIKSSEKEYEIMKNFQNKQILLNYGDIF